MAEPFLGEIRLFAFGLVPTGWLPCNGQQLQIQQYQALYSLLGTQYGGNGSTNFNLPNLQGRVPIHFNPQLPIGTSAGEETHTLTVNEIPQHNHSVNASNATSTAISPQGAALGLYPGGFTATVSGAGTMNAGALATAGQSQPHENRQPYLAVQFCMAVSGIFPSRN